MKVVLINGSPRIGNTHKAARILVHEMSKIGEARGEKVEVTEISAAKVLPRSVA